MNNRPITRLMVLTVLVLFGCLRGGSAEGELFVRFLFNEYDPGEDPNSSNVANSGHNINADSYDAIVYTHSVEEIHATYIAAPGGTALHLDGSTRQFITLQFPGSPGNVLPSSLITGGMTVAYWLRFEENSEDFMSLLTTNYGTSAGTNIQHQLKSIGTAPYSDRKFVNPDDTPSGSETQINADQWYHLVWTVEGVSGSQTQKFYVDGVLQYTDINQTVTIGSSEPARFGTTNTAGSFQVPFSGDLDQIEIYDYPLDGTEVTALYNDGAYVRMTGHEWVRANPPLIAGIFMMASNDPHAVDTPEEIEDYFMARFNYISYIDSLDRVTLDLARSVDPNCPAYLWSTSDGGVNSYRDTYGVEIPTIIQRYDEPHRSQFPAAQRELKALRAHFPEYLIMSNGNPSTANSGDPNYFADFVDTLKPDVLMSDAYPLKLNGFTDFGIYFNLMAEMRKVAVARDIPLWVWVQSETLGYGYVAINGRLPSESDLRMLMFSAMTFGVVGFNYLSYAHRIVEAVIDPGSNKTHVYRAAKKTNIEVLTLLETLKFAKTTGIFYVPGQPGNPVPEANGPIDLDIWSDGGDPDDHILDVSIDENDTLINGLIGFFNADDGQEYFMICNLYSGKGLSVDKAQVTYRVQFDGTVNSLLRLNRISGVEEVVTLTGNELVDLLPGGTGNLYKYNNGTSFLTSGYLPEYFCQDVIERGYGLTNDFNNDCHIDLSDLTILLQQWMSCVEVDIVSCDHPWQ